MTTTATITRRSKQGLSSPRLPIIIEAPNLWDPAAMIAKWTFRHDAAYAWQVCMTSLPLGLADIAGAGISIGLAAQLLGGLPANFGFVGCCFCLILLTANLFSGLYPGVGLSSAREFRMLLQGIGSGFLICCSSAVIQDGIGACSLLWALSGAFMLAIIPVARVTARGMVSRQEWWGIRTIVIGAGEKGMQVFNRLRESPELGIRPVALVDAYRPTWADPDNIEQFLGPYPIESTPELSGEQRAYCGIFIATDFPATERQRLIDALTSIFPHLYITADSADSGREWSGSLELGATRIPRITENLLMPGSRWMKRAIDLGLCLLFAPLIVPIVGFLALLVKLSSAGPMFYGHDRIGKNGRTIKVWKLRTMIVDADVVLEEFLDRNPELKAVWERLHKLPNDPRVTTIGRILRKTSLDELPQVWNVVCGQLSLVGPRPIVKAEVEKYKGVYPLYLRVTPGITGLWQINGRNSTTYEERVSYDAEYIRNWSICMDLYILVNTIPTVVTCRGAS